jgi:hypothetical protein
MMVKIWPTGRSESLISLAFMLKMAAMKDNGNYHISNHEVPKVAGS